MNRVVDLLQNLFWYYVAKDQEMRAEGERQQVPLVRKLWKSRKYPNSFLYIHTFLPFYDVCALYEVLYALERKNYMFFERWTDMILQRLTLKQCLPKHPLSEIRDKLYNAVDPEIWKLCLEAYFLTFESDELILTTSYLPFPVEKYRILDLSACHLPD